MSSSITAAVVIAGLITSMLLKLVVLPAIYPWFDPGPPAPEVPAAATKTQGRAES